MTLASDHLLLKPKLAFAHYLAMTETDAERYRRRADECRKLAERSTNHLDRKSWLHLAEDWIKLAEADEEGRAKPWPPSGLSKPQ